MAAPSVTYTLTNGRTNDANEVNQNFTDIINGITDGTKTIAPLSISLKDGSSGTPSLFFTSSTGQGIYRIDASTIGMISKLNLASTDGISESRLRIFTNSATADALLQLSVDNASSFWSAGIDSSDSGKFKVSNSGTLGSSDFLTITTGGLATLGAVGGTATHVLNGGLQVLKASGSLTINLDASASSASSTLSIRSSNAVTNGSAQLSLVQVNAETFTIGINSASANRLEFANSISLGSAVRAFLTTAGSWVFGVAAIATNATDGFIYIKSCAGAPTGVPTTQTGTIPMIFDSTNNKIYYYNSGWKSATVA
jgi:hypothetical protein